MLYSNGDFYQGGWKQGEKNGYGVLKYADGTIKIGQWN